MGGTKDQVGRQGTAEQLPGCVKVHGVDPVRGLAGQLLGQVRVALELGERLVGTPGTAGDPGRQGQEEQVRQQSHRITIGSTACQSPGTPSSFLARSLT